MKNEQFDELLKSMHEMDRIVQGESAPGRVTRFTEPEVKQIRENTGLLRRRHDRSQHCRLHQRGLSLVRQAGEGRLAGPTPRQGAFPFSS